MYGPRRAREVESRVKGFVNQTREGLGVKWIFFVEAKPAAGGVERRAAAKQERSLVSHCGVVLLSTEVRGRTHRLELIERFEPRLVHLPHLGRHIEFVQTGTKQRFASRISRRRRPSRSSRDFRAIDDRHERVEAKVGRVDDRAAMVRGSRRRRSERRARGRPPVRRRRVDRGRSRRLVRAARDDRRH